MRTEVGTKGESRSSALWGKRSGSRGNASRTSRGRGFATFLVLLVAVAGPLASTGTSATQKDYKAYVTPTLLTSAQAQPSKTFKVIVQGDGTTSSAGVGNAVASGVAQTLGKGRMYAALFSKNRISDKFRSINGVAATLTGRQILKLADRAHIVAITADAPIELSGWYGSRYENKQKWPSAADVTKFWRNVDNLDMPAIAIIDSGIDANRSDFAYGQVVAQKTMTNLKPNSPGDGRGHGTFVASIAAGVGRGLRRCRSRRADRLDRRHGRQGHGHDERRHRLGRLDPREQGSLQHQGRELLAPLGGPEQLHVRPAREGGREALVRRRRRWSRRPATTASTASSRASTTRPAAIRSSSRSARRTSASSWSAVRRQGRPVVGIRLHARRLRQARAQRSRPLHGRRGSHRLDARRASAPSRCAAPATWSFRARRSRPRSSPASPPTCWPCIRRGRRTR